jgi:hypothetical protein
VSLKHCLALNTAILNSVALKLTKAHSEVSVASTNTNNCTIKRSLPNSCLTGLQPVNAALNHRRSLASKLHLRLLHTPR